MTEHDMRHMDYLEMVTLSDVEVLRQKESTYKGSWKRAGGRSAWFMARRNMDRLIEMMKKPDTPAAFNLQNMDDTIAAFDKPGFSQSDGRHMTVLGLPSSPQVTQRFLKYLRDSYVSENIFAKIQENSSGEDGTVLACMRDLRRYLTLVEAEMVARGVVQIEIDEIIHFDLPTKFSVGGSGGMGDTYSVGSGSVHKADAHASFDVDLSTGTTVDFKVNSESDGKLYVSDVQVFPSAGSGEVVIDDSTTEPQFDRKGYRLEVGMSFDYYPTGSEATPYMRNLIIDSLHSGYVRSKNSNFSCKAIQLSTVDPTRLAEERSVPRRVPPHESRDAGGTDGDESRHASLCPWQVSELSGNFLIRSFYKHAAPRLFRLEPFIVSEKIPKHLAHCYDLSTQAKDTWILRIQNLPEELRDSYPFLPTELNAKEHEENKLKFMYDLDTDDNKYKLRKLYVNNGWGKT